MPGISLAETMPIMVTQTFAMFLMMLVGVILVKTNHLDDHGAAQMANVALYVANPAVTIVAFATTFDMAKLVDCAVCMALTWVFTIIAAAIAWLIYRDRQRISQLGITLTNMGFMGIPLVQAVLGEQYVFYITACLAAQLLITFSYGIWLISQDKNEVSPKRIFTNPAIVAVFVGVLLFLGSVHLPSVLDATASKLADLNTGLAMLVLGSYLANADLRSILRNQNLHFANFVHLVVIPLIVVICLLPLPLAVPIKLTLVIAFAAPSATVAAIFSQMYGKDYRFGAVLVSSSTLFSLITMPLMLGIGLALF